MIITLVLLGNLLEKRAVARTTTAIGELTKLQVQKARKIVGTQIVEVDTRDLKSGDILQVNEGDKIPADGELIEGTATVDESMLTGESEPILKEKGATLVNSSNLHKLISLIFSDLLTVLVRYSFLLYWRLLRLLLYYLILFSG